MKIGIVGGGQLAQMLVLAGIPLGLRFIVLDPNPDACCVTLCPQIIAAYDDIDALKQLAAQVDVITFDFENVSVSALSELENITIYPPINALAIAQDRYAEKQFFTQHNIQTVSFALIEEKTPIDVLTTHIGLPILVKTRRFGYDGKGQWKADTLQALTDIQNKHASLNLIAEAFLPFDAEVSLIAARNAQGDIVYYPLTKNTHQAGILHTSIAPWHDPMLWQQAKDIMSNTLIALDYVGVLTIEFFVKNGQLYVNEMAPRVHNSGHWSIEGANISQFEMHLRAITQLPLIEPKTYGISGMINFIGQKGNRASYLSKGAHYHDYGKTEREGRKVGHATFVTDDFTHLTQLLSDCSS